MASEIFTYVYIAATDIIAFSRNYVKDDFENYSKIIYSN